MHNQTGGTLIEGINYTRAHMLDDIGEAVSFHDAFMESIRVCPDRGLFRDTVPDWAAYALRKKDVPGLVVEKVGSLTFAKRRPNDIEPFLAYVRRRYQAAKPLLFRAAFGPLKNVNLCGDSQAPDLAEYLTLVQLTRLMESVAFLYPYGVKVQLVPDDLRARKANLCPENYTRRYISGLTDLVGALSLDGWMAVEQGEARLYKAYRVETYLPAAEEWLTAWRHDDPAAFEARWETALANAEKNLCRSSPHCMAGECAPSSAWRYLVAHRAEIMSGMWSPDDAFPLVFSNHPDSYQVYSLARKKSTLPWQVSLPVGLAEGADGSRRVLSLFE